jgi:hypothetical protein
MYVCLSRLLSVGACESMRDDQTSREKAGTARPFYLNLQSFLTLLVRQSSSMQMTGCRYRTVERGTVSMRGRQSKARHHER